MESVKGEKRTLKMRDETEPMGNSRAVFDVSCFKSESESHGRYTSDSVTSSPSVL